MAFVSLQDLEEVTKYQQTERRFMAETKEVSFFRALTPSLIGLELTLLFTFIIYEDAITLEDGGYVNTSGRRLLFKQLFAWLAKQLGSQNKLIVGGVIAVVCLYFMHKAFKNPPNEVVYHQVQNKRPALYHQGGSYLLKDNLLNHLSSLAVPEPIIKVSV